MRAGTFSGFRSNTQHDSKIRIYTEGSKNNLEECRANIKKPQFNEDPSKAVFLSGFNTDCIKACDENEIKWAKYRSAVYEDLTQKYGVYIRKFDLPKFGKSGYVHLKNKEQAEDLINKRMISLNGETIVVYPYMKTQTRINSEVQKIQESNYVRTGFQDTIHQPNSEGTTLFANNQIIPGLKLNFYPMQNSNLDSTNLIHPTSTPISSYKHFDFQSDITSDIATEETFNRFKSLSTQNLPQEHQLLDNQTNLDQEFKTQNLPWSTLPNPALIKPNINATEFKPNCKYEKYSPKIDDFPNINITISKTKNDIYAGGDNQILDKLNNEARPASCTFSNVNNFSEILSPHNPLSSFQNQNFNGDLITTTNQCQNRVSDHLYMTNQELHQVLNIIVSKLRPQFQYIENIENEYLSNGQTLGHTLKTVIESLMNECKKKLSNQQQSRINQQHVINQNQEYNYQNYGYLNQTADTNCTDLGVGNFGLGQELYNKSLNTCINGRRNTIAVSPKIDPQYTFGTQFAAAPPILSYNPLRTIF